ncbi:hypothetical protein Hypma_001638 [Hypsizygus marmoreus]|uniref:Uncharacterized protein n=1 Tax=Hypsizygus marmoreus TaxID=39966 RepID=A0A369JCJ2_HYPMA|nr:hypothetical protein Hypma_001638 [Hypsizygus marmoreus]
MQQLNKAECSETRVQTGVKSSCECQEPADKLSYNKFEAHAMHLPLELSVCFLVFLYTHYDPFYPCY